MDVSEDGNWKRTGDIITKEIIGVTTRYPIKLPYHNTYIQILLQAHNEFGYSQKASLIIKAVRGELTLIRL